MHLHDGERHRSCSCLGARGGGKQGCGGDRGAEGNGGGGGLVGLCGGLGGKANGTECCCSAAAGVPAPIYNRRRGGSKDGRKDGRGR
jgi:hypothetical protein